MFCLSTMQEECLQGQGIVLPVRWSTPWPGRREAKIRPSKGYRGQGGLFHWSGGRTSGLRWREFVSPNFLLILEAHLTALTVHDGSLISAVWWSQCLFMLQLSSHAIHCHSSCPYMNSSSFFSFVREEIKQSRTTSLIKQIKFLLWLAAHLIGALICFFSIKRLLSSPAICEPHLSNEQLGLSWTYIYYY